MVEKFVYMDTLLSSYSLQFLWNNSIKYFKFCVKTNSEVAIYDTGNANLKLEGTNFESYQL